MMSIRLIRAATFCHVPDVWGARIGEQLHMTVKESAWWFEQLVPHWRTVETLRVQHGASVYWTAH